MKNYDYIRTAKRFYGKSIKRIARETGHSKNTVKKALKGEYKDYNERRSQPYPVLGPYISIIDKWLEADKEVSKKQRHTATRICNRLKSERGYSGSDSTVRQYVRKAKQRLGLGKECTFIPLEPEMGIEAEADWGKCKAIIDGNPANLSFFCIRSKYSGKHFVCCYYCEKQQAFFDAHIRAFDFFGGVFPVIIYDNLRTAVKKVLLGHRRKLQESFIKFRAYYNYEPRFCNVNQGHEKGGVEGIVGFSRRNYMVPIPQVKSLQELNDKLLEQCFAYGNHTISGRDKPVSALYEEEKSKLIILPEVRFSNIKTAHTRVDKYSTVIVDKNRYSVPTDYGGMKVSVIVYVDKIEFFYGTKRISVHERKFGGGKWSLDPQHYLKLIQKRPFAFDSARPIKQWRKSWPESLEKLLTRFREKQGHSKGTKDFISILMLYKDYESDAIEKAVTTGLESGISSSPAIKHILYDSMNNAKEFSPLKNWQQFEPPDVSAYNQLGGGL